MPRVGGGRCLHQEWRPKGRLAAVVAEEEGTFRTFPIPVMGRGLRINARTRRAGVVKVGLVARAGRSPEDCDPVTGDSLAHPVAWKGDPSVGVAPGESVSLAFFLRKAELFGFEWVP